LTEVPLTESLRNFSLPRIFASINRRRLTGTLSVAYHGITKKVYFQIGNAIFASSGYEDDRLGEVLLKEGKITVHQYDESVDVLKKTGRRQGAILVDLGYLTPKDLFWAVKYQVREIIYSLFQLQDGAYEFVEGTIPSEVITLNMSTANLIYEGVKRIEDWTRIRREMPDTERVFEFNDDPVSLFQDIELGPQDKGVLSLVDGKRTIKKVIVDSGLNSLDALKTLYTLWAIGIITEKKDLEATFSLSLDDILGPVKQRETAFEERVSSLWGRLGSLGPADLLEVEPTADLETIKKSYFRLAKEFHPDRQRELAEPSARERLMAIFDAITDAYNALKAEAERPKVDVAGADEAARLGMAEMKAGNFSLAADFLAEAVRLKPDSAAYWNYLSLALSRLPQKAKEAEEAILKAINLDPSNSGYHTNLGLIHLKGGRKADARKKFQEALSLDPGNQRARQALEKMGG
jgi:Tfp pilus assembly protein PilF